MRRAKITIIGAGNVGATTAHWCAAAELGDIVLLDIPQTGDMPKGKGLDLMQAVADRGLRLQHHRHHDYADTAGSDVVVITAGIPRKPGMSRDDLLATNAKIVADVCEQVKTHQRARGRDRRQQSARRDGAAGPASDRLRAAAASSARPACSIRPAIARSWRWNWASASKDISALLMGGHGDTMVPMPSCTSVGGIPVTQLIDRKRLDEIVERTRNGGAEIVSLLKTGSAYYAPAAATAQMVEAIVRDKKRLIPCAAYCDKEYGVGGYYVGVPVILGASGVERIIELELTADEQAAFQKSVQAVKELVAAMAKLV